MNVEFWVFSTLLPGRFTSLMRTEQSIVAVLALVASLALADESVEVRPRFMAIVSQQFATWDRDGDGVLTPAEIDSVVADPQVQGVAAAAISALKRATRSSRYKLTELTLPQIEQLIAAGPSKDRPDLEGMFRNGRERIEEAHRDLFASGAPRLDTIHQGRLGNCYCLAPLGAVLCLAPERVSGMFALQSDGSFQVQFGPRSVRVSPPTDAEIAQTASNERDGMWINLYEKAVGEDRNAAKPPEQRTGSPIDAMARGGSAGTMLSFITGHKIQRFSFAFAKQEALSDEQRLKILEELRTYLREAVEERRAMTCGTEKTTTPGLNPNHAYAVLTYDDPTDCVQLWNPHGGQFTPKGPAGLERGYPTKDGVFSLPLADFVRQFAGMARETDLPAGDEPELPKLPGTLPKH
jgi:hypothetical protein